MPQVSTAVRAGFKSLFSRIHVRPQARRERRLEVAKPGRLDQRDPEAGWHAGEETSSEDALLRAIA